MTTTLHTEQLSFQDKIEQLIDGVTDPTQEKIESLLQSENNSAIKLLAPFTGYYGITNIDGAFLSIDTLDSCYQLSEKIVIKTTAITINISMDGKTSKNYPVNDSVNFDGRTLIIPNVLQVTLTRNYQDGALTTLSGTINNTRVQGSTQFNPIKLHTFNGVYYALTSSPFPKILSIGEQTIAFDFGQGMQIVKLYTFNPLMFVLTFSNPSNRDEKYTLMLGTASGMGLACYVQYGAGGNYAVTIPPKV